MSQEVSSLSLDADLIERLFPFYMALSPELRLIRFGHNLPKICRGISGGEALSDLFTIYRPRVGQPTYDGLLQKARNTFLMDSKSSGIRVRGQIIREPKSGLLLFFGGPWFTDIRDLEKSDLQLQDFTVHDPIVDFLYMVQAEQMALLDARRFSETVTQQRDELETKNRELTLANAAKSQFLANTSHELRTPLNGIIGMATLLLHTHLDTTQRDYASKVVRSGEALLVVVNDILDFSKIEAGKLTLEQIPFSLHDLLQDVADLFAVSAQAKGLEVACEIDPAVSDSVIGDPTRLRQILSNLIGNAVKFTSAGLIYISVRPAPAEGAPDDVRFAVRDTGIGISEEQRTTLFRAFSQADGSMTRRYGGTGLGLVISKNLCELMGGQIGVDSQVSVGSTFWFTAQLSRAAESAPVQAPSLDGLRVLVCDDQDEVRRTLTRPLSDAGARCTMVGDAVSALCTLRAAAAQSDPFHVAILDSEMPGMTGIDLAFLLGSDPSFALLFLILLVPMKPEARREIETRRLRTEGVLTKPVRPSHLLTAVAHLRESSRRPASRPLRTKPPDPAILISVPPRRSSAPTAPSPAIGFGEPALPGIDLDESVGWVVIDEPDSARGDSVAPRILVVDDNVINQEVAANMVRSLGYDVDVAADGSEALAQLRRRGYAMVITDLQMPQMDGYEATAALRQLETAEGRPRTPVVAMTAHAMESDRQNAMRAGLDDYLAKPVNFQTLQSILHRWAPLNPRRDRPTAYSTPHHA